MKNVVVVWRDGRDVMVSWYYQNLFSHEWRNDPQVERARREFSFRNYDDIYENLPEFIGWAFTQKRSSPRLSWTDPRFSWADFVRPWYHRKDVVPVRYEDLRRETVGGLQRIVLELTGSNLSPEKASAIAEEFSFQRQADRRPGEEDRRSFLRKGVVGDWRNQFSKGAQETFDRYAGKELVLLGYEQDSSWTEDTEEKYVANPDASGPA